MNRRRMLSAASTFALAGMNGNNANAQNPPAKNAPQGPLFSSNLKINLAAPPRPLTKHELYTEAQVATMLLIALHKTPQASILPNAKPTGSLTVVEPGVYGKVREYMTKFPGVVQPILTAFQGVVQDVTLFAAGSNDDGGYTGPPEGCLSQQNTALITKALATVPKA